MFKRITLIFLAAAAILLIERVVLQARLLYAHETQQTSALVNSIY